MAATSPTKAQGTVRRPRRRRRGPQRVAPPASPYVTRRLPPYEILSEESLAAIEAQADNILQEIGVEFRGVPEALRLWREAGASVAGERVRFERGMLSEIVRATAPKDFVQQARNPARSVPVGGDHVVFVPVYGPPFVQSLDEARRYAGLADFDNFVKLAHMSPYLHHTGGVICEPVDVPVSQRHLDMVYGHIRYSDKPFMGAVTSGERAEDTLAMTRLVFGEDFLEDHCCLVNLINVNSPLVLDETMLGALEVYARHGQATVVTPFIIAGASGPTSLAGIMAQAHAETLAGLALTQLIRPGAAVIYGFLMTGINMRSGAPIRYAETWQGLLVAGQLARRLGVPFRCGGASSSSKLLDAQAGLEGAFYLMASLLAGVNFLIHATGTCEAGLSLSYEKYVLDCDVLGAMQRFLAGFSMDEAEFALDAFREVGPGGNFLACAHTLARYRDAFYESELLDTNSFEQWRDEGALDVAQRANILWKQRLADYEAPPLDPAIDEALKAFIAERKATLPDSFA